MVSQRADEPISGCGSTLMTVQVTAGNRLFNVVVDNDDTASRIVALLNRDKYAAAWLCFTS